MTTWQSCDCYLPPVNGHSLCLTFFSYAFAPLFFCSLFLFFRLFFYPCFFFSFCLISYCLSFCSFLFIGKASLEPADYPRVLLYKKSSRQKPGASEIPPFAAELPHRRGHNVFTKGADGNSGQARRSSRGTGCPPRRRRARPPPFPTPWWNRRRASFRNRVGSPRG